MSDDDLESLPGCFLCFPRMIEPNSCGSCPLRGICEAATKKVKERFVPKDLLREIDMRLDRCLRIIHEG